MNVRPLAAALIGALVSAAAHSQIAVKGDPAKAQQIVTQVCAACHGPDGNSAAADFPKLAGQHYDYLVKTLKDYKSGARKNAIMAPQVANLTARDFEDLAAFYSSQQGLVVRKNPYIVPSGKH